MNLVATWLPLMEAAVLQSLGWCAMSAFALVAWAVSAFGLCIPTWPTSSAAPQY